MRACVAQFPRRKLPSTLKNGSATLPSYVPGTHWHELPKTPQLHVGTNPGLQLLAETEQPMPRTLEHWHTPGFDVPPPPVPPPPPVVPEQGQPQLQVTSDPADTTPAPERGQKES